MSADAFFSIRRDYYRDKYFKQALNDGKTREQALEQSANKADQATNNLKNQLNVISDNQDKANTEVNKYSDTISELNTQLTKANISPQEVATLKAKLEYNQQMHKGAIQKQAEFTKELQALSNSNDPDIVKSDFSELFNSLTETIKDFLSVLSSEQLVIVFNLCGYTILIMLMTSITTIIIGQDLINYFQLESKYPKIATYIRFQLTLRKYYLRFYIVYFYFIFLILISVNIFMFTYNFIYFV
jgi:plasmid maintenance system killer protein